MPQQNEWSASVTAHRPEHTTVERLDALTRALPGFGIVVDNGTDRVRMEMTVQAPTARAACEAAVRAARAAYSQAFGGQPDITQVRVLTAEDYERELVRPAELDLVGKSEAAEILGVSPQRVDELGRSHPDFPPPVATLKMGTVYTRASIEEFGERRVRRPGRPRKIS